MHHFLFFNDELFSKMKETKKCEIKENKSFNIKNLIIIISVIITCIIVLYSINKEENKSNNINYDNV